MLSQEVYLLSYPKHTFIVGHEEHDKTGGITEDIFDVMLFTLY